MMSCSLWSDIQSSKNDSASTA